jgi:primosomal protein N' (replication factor Y)
MRREAAENPGKLILSTELEKAILKRVEKKEQVILLLNRRGFAPVVLCPICGWVPECSDCQVSLTYHRKGSALQCHYCQATRPNPLVCGECGFNPLLYLGLGTQKAEDYLLRSFGDARVERMDADTTAGRGGHAKILERFARREIDILIGTQMLAKGHDYPGVTLVGVINADAGLTLPDFRAAEQAFQLLTQVAGRAGRGSLRGEVLIQTHRPNHYAVQTASRHDYAAFYRHEIREREAAGYPPFRRMVNFMIEGNDPLHTERASVLLRRLAVQEVEKLGYRGVALLGPAPAAIRRIKKTYRWNFAMLSRSSARINTLSRALREAFENNRPEGNIRIKVDLDPYGMF